MADKRKICRDNHSFREHGIGAGLTRKVCVGCGLLQIGQGRRVVLVEDPWAAHPLSNFVKVS